MDALKKDITLKFALRTLSFTMVFNTMIAIFLTGADFGDGFGNNFIFSQCIGLSICGCILALVHLKKTDSMMVQLAFILMGLVLGALIGILIGSMVAGMNLSVFGKDRAFFFRVLLNSILFGSIISYFFISREQISDSKARMQEERIRRLTIEKKAAQTSLRLLQAQIEPHFLFNTLSNILSLLETDSKKAGRMLANLTRYLRTSLSCTRVDSTTISEEMERIRSYIEIFKVRMGDRLRSKIDVSDEAAAAVFPPMLIQPLVENAIKHGLEPKVEGGEISIKVDNIDAILRVEVADTGLGTSEGGGGDGVGLSNIRERLRSLYGDKGRLILEENQPSGLKAVIEAPCRMVAKPS